jgi:hypothetical protein
MGLGRKSPQPCFVADTMMPSLQTGIEAGSVQSFSHFRSSSACWKVVGFRLFCSWPPWGPGAKRSGDGNDFGQSVHLQVAFGTPLGCGNMPEPGSDQHQR